MKRIALVIALLALVFSPLTVPQANAAPVKHHVAAKHHRKLLKKRAAKRLVRKHHRKVNV